ncbi:uncharacterized protein LOC133195059 [Saccostrea echinata]|uniref:uncharacterized protein LOC133195059 n=1 Tax=Saccostrea echinata TaxID=191078 RepID=UPI002A7FB0D6|nr:uncharacterized protein LOC133195059 [Saccostrea echinata]
MACSITEQKGLSEVDFSKCPVCFEQFKTPRVLPCSHIFCHDCVSSHIVSICQPKEDPLGFHCPVCREIVPAPSFSLNFKDWSEHFPTKRHLEDISPIICEACKRENETEGADNYCLSCCEALCGNCTKYHRKNRSSRDHKTCPLDEIKYVPEMSKLSSNIHCKKHKDRPIELFCNDHEEPRCAISCSTEHRKCESVETIQQKAEKVKSKGSIGVLLYDTKEFEQKLSETKCREEKNITEIDDEADAITGEVQRLKEKLIQNLETLENEFLDKISTQEKQWKEKLTKNIQTVGDKIHFMKQCRKDLETATSLQDVRFLMEFLKTKKTLDYIKNKQVEKIEFKLQSRLEENFKAVANLSKIGNTEIIEKRESLLHVFDVKNFQLELYEEWRLSGSSIRSVMFLSNTDVLFPDCDTNTIKRYPAKKDKWNFQNEIVLEHGIFEIKRNGDFYFASCPLSKLIKVLSAEDFQMQRTINVGNSCYGIPFWKHFLYTACDTSIIRMDTEGNMLRTYPTSSGVHYVAVTKNGDIVFSTCIGKHSVTATTDEGDTVWTYTHEKLRHPYCLHIDCDDLIYVAGTHSNNVHALTTDGFLLRMIEDMPSPVFFIFNKDRNICCMGTNVWETSIKMIPHGEIAKLMACSITEQKGLSEVNLSKCPICFEQFKTPRVLPCSHIFCHDCVSSHIVSTCQPKEDPLGFQCPVCRDFVPAPSFSLDFKDWSQHFPTNRDLGDISLKICEACERENETERADKYCLSCCEALCDNCTKCHRKSRATRDHKICRVDEIKCVPELSKLSSNIHCEKHKDRPIELFCNDHEEPCCAMCCSTEHRKCESVETIQQKAGNVRNSGSVGVLLNDIKEFEQKLSETKCREEKNITEIEDEADAITGEVQRVKQRIIQNLEKLENEFLDKISTQIKQCKEKLTKNIQTVGDKLHFMELCRKELETATNLQDVSFLMEFLKTKKTLDYIKNKKVEKIEFKLQSNLELDFKAVANVSKIGNAEIIENRESLLHMFDVKNLQPALYQEWQLPGSSIRSAMFLSNTDVIFPDWLTNTVKRYSAKKDKWIYQTEIMLGHGTFEIKRNGDFYFASCISSQVIKVLSAEDFQMKRTIHVGDACYGISFWKHFLYAACSSSIIKMDTEGNQLRIYPTSSGVHYVAVTKNGHIVFSAYKGKHSVTAITDEGDNVWTYVHQCLRHPYGLHIDCDDIIYVAGTNSNNVHVLTSNGFLLRIIEDMPSPVFFIFNKDRNICCMGTNVWETRITMYAIKF